MVACSGPSKSKDPAQPESPQSGPSQPPTPPLSDTSTPAIPATGNSVIVLQKDMSKTGQAQFLGNADSLGAVQTPWQATGLDVFTMAKDALSREAELYRRAQIASGVPADKLQPIVIVLDPNPSASGIYSMEYAELSFSKAPFSYKGPIMVMGQGRDYIGQVKMSPTMEDRLTNRDLTYRVQTLANVSNFRMQWGSYALDIPTAAENLSTYAYLQQLQKLVSGGVWAQVGAENLRADAKQRYDQAVRGLVLASVSHELGHLIQYAALRNKTFSLGNPMPHVNGGQHYLDTLSNPAFAFAEGFATANAMVVAGINAQVDEQGRSTAVLIDYQSTLDYVQKKLASNSNSPETQQLRTTLAYLQDLQARKGQLKSRYDFLRSEYSVGYILRELRLALGQEASWGIARAIRNAPVPQTLANVLEQYVHENPALKMQIYQILHDRTYGILMSDAELAYMQANPNMEFDIDKPEVVWNGLTDPLDYKGKMSVRSTLADVSTKEEYVLEEEQIQVRPKVWYE